MATRWRALHKKRNRRPIVRCERCGSRDVMECQIVPWEEPQYLCCTDAEKLGFCAGCGIFSAGIDSYDFGRYRGFCENCSDELAADDAYNFGEEYEEDYDFEEVY
jgi:hypothetical protein